MFITFLLAVLVNQTSLFILFGLDKDANPTNDLLVLDVRDVNNISFASTFPFDNTIATSGNGTANTSNSSGGGSLSTGAIAGIAVGGVAAVSRRFSLF
jgi:hypothetical protein